MATKPKDKSEPKRLNRTVGVGEALGNALDGVLKKRGFASRDIITQWPTIAPEPYGRVTRPDKLSWPRGERGAEGAVLYLSCHAGHRLALAHETQRVAAAINRYFGYLLVGEVRLSATPFEPTAPPSAPPPALSEAKRREVSRQVERVADDGVRAALEELGQALLRRKR